MSAQTNLLAGDPLSRSGDRFQSQVRGLQVGRDADQEGRLRETAREFESLFAAYLLKVMRETIEESGLGGEGLGKNIYSELFDQEIAALIGRRGALGISDILLNRLSEPAPAAADPHQAPGLRRGGRAQPDAPEGEIPDFRMPVQAPISSHYGPRRDPFTRAMRHHKGMDIAAPSGTQVMAAMGGEVVFAGRKPGYGNTVVLRHSDGFETLYAHLESVAVREGEVLNVEQVLGRVGSTGRSTGSHLHFEVRRFGDSIDPRLALAE